MKGLVLSGGYGTRLRPLTYSQQKQLIPVANKPIIFYGIEDMVKAGIRDIGIIVGPNKEQVMEVVGDGSRWNCRIEYINQEKPLGLAHAVKISRTFIDDDSFVMYLGDNILRGPINRYIKEFRKFGSNTVILLSEVDNPKQFGIAKLNPDGSIQELLEKPENPPSNLAIVGLYIFDNSIFDAIDNIKPSPRGELEITDAMQYQIENKAKVNSAIVEGWWKDTGKPDDILEVNRLVLEDIEPYNRGSIGEGASVSGRVAIGEGTVVKKGSTIEGPVIIGDNCEIGPDARIGSYTSIGNNSTIRNASIDYSLIMDNTVIDFKGRIEKSLIGRDVKIEKHDNNKFIIGDHSRVWL